MRETLLRTPSSPLQFTRGAETLTTLPSPCLLQLPEGKPDQALLKCQAAASISSPSVTSHPPILGNTATSTHHDTHIKPDDLEHGTNTGPPVLPQTGVRHSDLLVLEPQNSVPEEANLSPYDIYLLRAGRHNNPFSILGPHWTLHTSEDSSESAPLLVIRAWVKNAQAVSLRFLTSGRITVDPLPNDNFIPLVPVSSDGGLFHRAFRLRLRGPNTPSLPTEEEILYTLRVFYVTHLETTESPPKTSFDDIRDAYNFGLLLSDTDLHTFQSGSCWHVDDLMGAHAISVNGVTGVRFAVWAPNATSVSVVGTWNEWDPGAHPMRLRVGFGVWELFIPHLEPGILYKYRIHNASLPDGQQDMMKIDPYAQEFEVPPRTASILSSCDDAYKAPAKRFQWTDDAWMAKRKQLAISGQLSRSPMAIYEVHLPSWRRGDDNTLLGYRDIADPLVQHLQQFHFTHVEFLPLAHHPFDGSWGYQVSGQYAPYSRLGTPDDLKFLINQLHVHNIGVFLDFVPAHFVKDDWGLVRFDGQPCYEYADPREGEHKGWGTLMFNFRRHEVRSFLLGAAYHWLRRYHIDGLRIDAVSSMLYKSYCREPGEWLPNEYGGDANLQAITFLQELNWVIHQKFMGVFTMAEESTSWPGVTDRERGGLAFDAKWDLGWMNDTLSYLCTPGPQRAEKHSNLTFRGLYVGHEQWVLPLSHDEVVSGKGSLLDKCGFAGTPFWERLRTLRVLYGFQIGIPGRPLLFMGGEFGQGREWNHERSIDWHELQDPSRQNIAKWVTDLLKLYCTEPALHAGDDEAWNFQWVDCDNATDNLVAWVRKYQCPDHTILVVCNFSGNNYHSYPLGVPHGEIWTVLLNSDDWKYGGSMFGLGPGMSISTTLEGRYGWPYCLWLDIPAFSCLFLKVKPEGSQQPTKSQPPVLTDAKPLVQDTFIDDQKVLDEALIPHARAP